MTDRREDGRPVLLTHPAGPPAIPTHRPYGEVTAGTSGTSGSAAGSAGSAAPPHGAGGGSGAVPESPAPAGPVELLAERTADLQRLQAEYENYRKRVRRDRLAVGQVAVANVLARLLPVLDAVDSARELGQLEPGLRAVAGLLESELGALGLQSVGAVGEPFDPNRHEAVARVHSAAVTGPTCVEILRAGYRVGPRLLRPAEVVVAEPYG